MRVFAVATIPARLSSEYGADQPPGKRYYLVTLQACQPTTKCEAQDIVRKGFLASHKTTHNNYENQNLPPTYSLVSRSFQSSLSLQAFTTTRQHVISPTNSTVHLWQGQAANQLTVHLEIGVLLQRLPRLLHNTLNKEAEVHHHKPAAILDPWGGVDWINVYPNEISVLQGKEYLKACLIRPNSPIRRVYTTCCYTPMFNIGSMSALINTNLIVNNNLPDVRFRIIGRHALPAKDTSLKKPPMSWSVPFSFPFVMMKRVQKDKMEPLPLDMDDVSVLENFKEG